MLKVVSGKTMSETSMGNRNGTDLRRVGVPQVTSTPAATQLPDKSHSSTLLVTKLAGSRSPDGREDIFQRAIKTTS